MSSFISSIPTIEKDDLRLSKELLLKRDVKDIQVTLPGFEDKEHFYTNTGRSSLYILLKALKIGKGHEVIVQSFTCMALIAPLIWLNIVPVYTDIDLNTYNMDFESLKKKITNKTRAVIVQHTFGIPAEIEKIKRYIDKINKNRWKKRKIYLIEDCAHCLNIRYKDKYLGSFGDASFFSFGQDKVVSTTQGGCLIANNKKIEKKIGYVYRHVSDMPKNVVRYNLRYPLLWNFIKKLYFTPKFLAHNLRFSRFTIGKGFVILFRLFGLIKQQASATDFGDPKGDILKLSIKQKYLLKNQLDKIDRFTKHREEIAAKYSRLLNIDLEGSLLRYPVVVDNPSLVRSKLQMIDVIGGNWYNYPVIPKGIDLRKIDYHLGTCINTEYVMSHMINLSTGIDVTEKDVERIVNIVKPHLL